MLYIIANETAGSGAGKRITREVEVLLQMKGLPCSLSVTSRRGDAALY